jgi:hypothetical protein
MTRVPRAGVAFAGNNAAISRDVSASLDMTRSPTGSEPEWRLRKGSAAYRRIGRLGRRDALQEFEFVPPRVEKGDFVSRGFQLSLQIENLRARFRIKIRRGKHSL